MIEVEHLGKQYGSFHAVEDVSFGIARGEVVGFLGPNGAGKTTTMRILTGYFPPSSGRARIAGYDVVEASLEARQRIGYLPESVPLYTEMTVAAYLDYVARLRRVPERHQAVNRAMARCQIDDRAEAMIGKLSKGQRQRVGLAQAILHEPDVLILDEPTIGLDPKQITEVRDLIKTLGQEHTVLLSTHILSEVRQTCDRILIIHQAKLVAQGTPDELATRLQGGTQIQVQLEAEAAQERILAVLGKISGVSGVTRNDGTDPENPQTQDRYVVHCQTERCTAKIARAVVEQGWNLLELRVVRVGLEEVFLALTREGHADRMLPVKDTRPVFSTGPVQGEEGSNE